MAEKVMLTAAAVAKLRPAAEPYDRIDKGAPGLRLRVHPSGKKTWLMVFRRPGDRHPSPLTLGPADLTGEESPEEPVIGSPLTLAGARRLAVQIQHMRAQGRDVIGERRAARQRAAAARTNTFGPAVRRYIEEDARPRPGLAAGRRAGNGLRNWEENARTLGLSPGKDGELVETKGGLAARWRDRPMADIDGELLHDLLDECQRRGIPGRRGRGAGMRSRARTMRLTLSQFFAWAARERLVPSNPMRDVAAPAQAPARERVLTPEELRGLWAGCEGLPQPFGPLFRLLLLTAQRRGEVSGMRWSELSADRALWTVPASRAKNGRAHEVPLSPLARQLIAAMPRREGCDLVFTTNGRTPVSGFSKAKRQLDAAMLAAADADAAPAPWRLHDLRRTAVTGMVEIGIDPHVVEAVVNHVSGVRAGVAGVYNHAKLREPKRAALDRWATHLEGLVAGRRARVIALRTA